LPFFGHFSGQIGPDMGGFCPKKCPKNGLVGLGLMRRRDGADAGGGWPDVN
jgi:hypothetical protein